MGLDALRPRRFGGDHRDRPRRGQRGSTARSAGPTSALPRSPSSTSASTTRSTRSPGWRSRSRSTWPSRWRRRSSTESSARSIGSPPEQRARTTRLGRCQTAPRTRHTVPERPAGAQSRAGGEPGAGSAEGDRTARPLAPPGPRAGSQASDRHRRGRLRHRDRRAARPGRPADDTPDADRGAGRRCSSRPARTSSTCPASS